MKKTLLYLAGAAALLAGCAKEVPVDEPVQGQKTITIQASIDPETRTTVEINGNKGVYSWVANEKIGVIEAPDNQDMLGQVVPFTVSDLDNGLFTGTLSDGFTLAGAVSPQSFVEGAAYAHGKLQYNITLSGDYNYADGTNAVMVAGAPTVSGDTYKFSFKHAAALFKVTYENVPVGTKRLSITTDQPLTGEFDFDSFENVEIISGSAIGTTETTIYVTLAEAVSTANQTLTFYAPIPTGTYGSVSVALQDASGNAIDGTTKSKTKSFDVARGDIIALPTITLEGETPVAGETYAWTLASGDLGETGSPLASVTKGTPELTWTAAYTWGEEADEYFGWDANLGRGVQIGKGSAANKCTSAIFTTTAYTGYVENIKLNFSHASSGGSSATVKVGDTDLVCGEETSVSGTTSAAYYVFTASELVKGDVVITLSNSEPKAMYLKSIEINPDTRLEQTLSFPQNAYSVELTEGTFAAPVLSGAMTPVSYTSENETVATVDPSTGAVTLLKVGSTVITATAAANDEYQEGSASYTLTVTAGPSSIADVISAENNASVYTQGVVAQVNAKGFIITDGTNNLLIYQNATPSIVVGQSVKVSGSRGTYNNIPQIASPVINAGATGQTVARTTLTTVTSANATGFTLSEYVSLTGTMTISGNYYNISIEGSTTKGSLYQVVSSASYSAGKLADLNETVVKVTGYVAGSSASYLNIAVVDIESMPYLNYTEPDVAGFAEDSQITIPVNSNVSWTASMGTDEDGIIKSVTYDSEKITVIFNANADAEDKTATVVITPDAESGLSAVEVTVTQSKYGEEMVVYTLDGTKTGGSNGYATESDITQNDILWKVTGNTTTNPWRIGGKDLTNVDRTLYSTAAIEKSISKIEVESGTATLTVNSITIEVASDSAFADVVSTSTFSYTAGSTVTFERPAGVSWENRYYRITYNVTAVSSNQYVQFIKAEFTGK